MLSKMSGTIATAVGVLMRAKFKRVGGRVSMQGVGQKRRTDTDACGRDVRNGGARLDLWDGVR
jgi:hypothetical protein